MYKIKGNEKQIIKFLLIAGIIFLFIRYFDTVMDGILLILSILRPVIVGSVIAYVLNLPMTKIEQIFMPHTDNPFILSIRRPVSILLSIIIIGLVLFIVFTLVVPQLISVIWTVLEVIPQFFDAIQNWLINNEELFPQLASAIDVWDFDWQNIARNALNVFNNLTSNVIGLTLSTVGTLLLFIINLFVSFMIALFLLMGKEQLQRQFTLLSETYLSERHHNRLMYIAYVTNDSFTKFIVGELISATIIGILVTVGMWVFRFPYAGMIGVLTGVTSLIPYLGAYLSGAVGFILIFVQSPIQAMGFLVFIVFIQQIEGNIIYPRVVGTSIGLPGLWVLIAITIGAGLMGIFGMLISVPIASTAYKLLKADIRYRRSSQTVTPAEVMATEGEIPTK